MNPKANNSLSAFMRWEFLCKPYIAATALSISPHYTFAFAGDSNSYRKVRVRSVCERFGTSFYFHEHPNYIVEAVSDFRTDRRAYLMKVYNCSKSHQSLGKLILHLTIEAVFIATPAPDHARHVIATLNAGKHVLYAIPAAWNASDFYFINITGHWFL